MTFTKLCELEEKRTKGKWTPSVRIHRDSPITLYAPDNQTAGMFTSTFGQENCEWIAACSAMVPKLMEAISLVKNAPADGCIADLQNDIEELGL